jgi:cytoplasmic iron level regulating protein YaaA (DUF328/UPF0246 family)
MGGERVVVLLPPSEGKAEGGDGPAWDPGIGAYRSLTEPRREVAAALGAAGGGDEKLLGVGGSHLERAIAANRRLIGAPTLPAWMRYTGVVWSNLQPEQLTAAERRSILVVSGLLGVVRGDDPVPEYRLKMGARLEPLGKLSTWWREAVTSTIARASRSKTVVDLLPLEHRAAWDPGPELEGLTVGFVDRSGKAGGHFAKAAKGRLAAALLREGVDAIDRWEDERFVLDVTPLGST